MPFHKRNCSNCTAHFAKFNKLINNYRYDYNSAFGLFIISHKQGKVLHGIIIGL